MNSTTSNRNVNSDDVWKRNGIMGRVKMAKTTFGNLAEAQVCSRRERQLAAHIEELCARLLSYEPKDYLSQRSRKN